MLKTRLSVAVPKDELAPEKSVGASPQLVCNASATHFKVWLPVGFRVYSTEIAIRNGAGSAILDMKSMLFNSTSGKGLSQDVRNKVLLSASRAGFTDQATTVLVSSDWVPGLENQSRTWR